MTPFLPVQSCIPVLEASALTSPRGEQGQISSAGGQAPVGDLSGEAQRVYFAPCGQPWRLDPHHFEVYVSNCGTLLGL